MNMRKFLDALDNLQPLTGSLVETNDLVSEDSAMTVSPQTNSRIPPTQQHYEELERIELLNDTKFENIGRKIVTMPAGSKGTIVGIWKGGVAYEIEFTRPFAALGAIEPSNFRKA